MSAFHFRVVLILNKNGPRMVQSLKCNLLIKLTLCSLVSFERLENGIVMSQI